MSYAIAMAGKGRLTEIHSRLCSGKPWVGWLLSAFAALIFVGSIHLGWHYAIDGYAGAAVAVFGWWAAGRLVAWDRRLRGAG